MTLFSTILNTCEAIRGVNSVAGDYADEEEF